MVCQRCSGLVLWLVQVARRKRIAETQARMQRQLAEKQARDKADLQKQEAQHDLRRVHEERIAAWKSGKKVSSRTARRSIVSVGLIAMAGPEEDLGAEPACTLPNELS